MNELGPIVLLILGALLILAALVVFSKGSAVPWSFTMVLIFGTLLSGSGVFGIRFVGAFGEFLKTSNMLSMISTNPSAETQKEAIDAVASGEVGSPYSEAILSTVLEHPVEQTGALLAEGASRAKKPAGRQALMMASTRYEQKARAASDLTEALASTGRLQETRVANYDIATKRLVAERLAAAPVKPIPGLQLTPAARAKILNLGGVAASANTPSNVAASVPQAGVPYKIASVENGQVLDVRNNATGAGAEVVRYGWHGGDNQKWVFHALAGNDAGWFRITSVRSGLSLSVQNAATNDGARIVQLQWTRANNQKWSVVEAAPGQVIIEAKHSKKVLDLPIGNDAGVENIQQWTRNSGSNQRWVLGRVH